NLLNSTADGISSLTGSQLIAQKMRGIFIMGGDYASGNEYNFNHSPAAWNNFFANKPAVPTYLWGFTPPNTVNSGPANNGGATVSPSYYGYDLETGGAPGTRPSWDQFAVLSAVRGPEYSLFQIVGKNGSNSVNASTGANTWTSTVGNDSYMGKVASDATIQTTLNNL